MLKAQEISVPQLHEHVTDFTNTLEFSEWRSLETQLKRFEDSTSTQIAVVMIQSLQGEDITDYSLKIAEANKIGTKGKDNGLLILIAKEDKEIRFEVGYGLEGSLPDALCDQIIRNEIRPRFRDGDYYGGISAGLDAVIEATKGEYKAESRTRDKVTNFGSVLLSIIIVCDFRNVDLRRRTALRHFVARTLSVGILGRRLWRRRIFWRRRFRRWRRWRMVRGRRIFWRRRSKRKLVSDLVSPKVQYAG